MSISLNDQYVFLRASAFDINQVAKAKSRRIDKLAAGSEVVDPTSAGVEAGSVLKLRNSGLRLRAIESGVINAISFLETQSSMFQQMSSVVSRLSELTVLMRDSIKSSQKFQKLVNELANESPDSVTYQAFKDSDEVKNDGEFQSFFAYSEEALALMEELSSYRTAQFNGRDLMNHLYISNSAELVSKENTLAVSLSEDGKNSATVTLVESALSQTLNNLLGRITESTYPKGDNNKFVFNSADLTDPSNWGQKGFDLLIQDLSQRIAMNLSEQSSLRLNLDRIRERMLGTEAATSRVADVDVAQELSALARNDMQFQGAIATKTQSNVLADSALMILSNQDFSSPLIREARMSTPFVR